MTFIAYNYNGIVQSIVVAQSESLAMAFWQGRGIIPQSVECVERDFSPIEEHSIGVFPILETEERELRNGRTALVVKRK